MIAPARDEVAPESTAARVALRRTLHLEVDPPQHVIEDEIGLVQPGFDPGRRSP